LEENVSNFYTNDKRRVEIKLWVDYDSDIIKTKKIILRVIEQFPSILKAPNPEILIVDFWDNSINLSLRFWINSKDDNYFEIKSNVNETINLAFKQSWIVIPFPQVMISNRK